MQIIFWNIPLSSQNYWFHMKIVTLSTIECYAIEEIWFNQKFDCNNGNDRNQNSNRKAKGTQSHRLRLPTFRIAKVQRNDLFFQLMLDYYGEVQFLIAYKRSYVNGIARGLILIEKVWMIPLVELMRRNLK